MARPTTKSELFTAANEQFEKLWKLVEAIPQAQQNAEFAFTVSDKMKEAHWTRDKNARDVFVHLYEWHKLLTMWVAANQKGENKPFLPAPYNWKTYDDMNVEFWKKHQSTSYEDAKKMLCDSHAEVMKVISQFTDEELFEKKHFSWTGASSLGSYCVSATSSHYDWAIKKLKLHSKTIG
jgi:Uncharacterized conserved protein